MCSKIDGDSLTGINIYITGKIEPTVDGYISNPAGYIYSDYELKKYCIVLNGDLGMYSVGINLEHELMHIIDSRIIQYSNELDKWNDFLPRGVDYYYSYIGNEEDYSYTMEDSNNSHDKCFINPYSKTFPTEDRAEIFKLLFYDGDSRPNELNQPIIFEKAGYLCKAMREYFKSVQDTDEVYWERFINSSN